MRFYEREAGFYREVADRIDLAKPKGFVNLYEPESDHNMLILEDIAPADDGDVTIGTDTDTARRLMQMLARLHGRFWMDPEIVRPWLHTWDREGFWSNAWIGQLGWDTLTEREPDFYPAELMEDVAYGLMYWVAGQPVTATMDLSHYGDHAERMGRRFRQFLEGTRDAAVRWDIVSILGP